MCKWEKVKLKNAGIILIDCDHKTPKSQICGFPYVGIPQLKDGRILLDGARLISEDDFHLWRRKACPQENDIILSRRCNPGETAFVPQNLEIALGQNLVLLRADGQKCFPPFLRWLTQGSLWWGEVNKYLNMGAVFDSLKCKDIPNFEIPLPPLEEQKRIAAILSSLDDKIEVNNQISKNLEEQAQAIFTSWFVDFEPFGGVMPNDWKEGTLGDVAFITSGKRPTIKESIKSKEFNIPLIGASSVMGYTNKPLYDEKILVIGRVGTHGIVQRWNKSCWTSDNTLILKSNYYEFVYQTLQKINYTSLNRGSTQPLITQTDIRNTNIFIPTVEILKKFENKIRIIMDYREMLISENEKNSNLRDTLHPKLINGEIKL